MKILLAPLLLAYVTCVKMNHQLEQYEYFYTVPYQYLNGIAMANFTFPGTDANFSSQVIMDLQQGMPSAWNCTGTSICDSYNLIYPNFTATPPLIYIGNQFSPGGF